MANQADNSLRNHPDEVMISLEELTIGEKIGSGGFGEVKKGTYRGQPVAIKFLQPEGRELTERFVYFIYLKMASRAYNMFAHMYVPLHVTYQLTS